MTQLKVGMKKAWMKRREERGHSEMICTEDSFEDSGGFQEVTRTSCKDFPSHDTEFYK